LLPISTHSCCVRSQLLQELIALRHIVHRHIVDDGERLLQAVAYGAIVGEAHDHGLSALRAEGMQCHAAFDALKAHVGRVGMRRGRLARRVGETRDRAHDGIQIGLVDEL
jgi:microcompartment protein CcmK/EutM